MLSRASAGARRLARDALGVALDVADERRKTSPATKMALRQLTLEYRRLLHEGAPLPSVWDTGFRVFSEFDEDGITLFLLAIAGTGTRRFVDIGAGDGVFASNTANLALNLGFSGVHLDADPAFVERGRRFYARHPDTTMRPPVSLQARVTVDNVNDLLGRAGVEGDIDLLAIDIDGNDFWIWQAVERVTPRFVVIEAQLDGLEDWIMPYDPDFSARTAPPGTRIGASLVAMVGLARRRGYRPVGANLYGFNVFFAREDVAPALPAVPVEDILRRAG